MNEIQEQVRQQLEKDALEIEMFHILHKAISLINEWRESDDKVEVLDREIGEAVKVLMLEDISRSLNRMLLENRNEEMERYNDIEADSISDYEADYDRHRSDIENAKAHGE